MTNISMVPMDPVENKFISAGIKPDAAKQFAQVVYEYKAHLTILGIGLEEFAEAVSGMLKGLMNIWGAVYEVVEAVISALTPFAMDIASLLEDVEEYYNDTPPDTPLTRKWRTERRRAERERDRVRYKYYEWRMMMATPTVQTYRGMPRRRARNESHRN